MGGAPSVQAPKPPDPGQEFQNALSAYTRNAPALYAEESQYQPLYNEMQQGIMGSNIDYYSQALQRALPGMQQSMLGAQNQAIARAAQNKEKNAGPRAHQP